MTGGEKYAVCTMENFLTNYLSMVFIVGNISVCFITSHILSYGVQITYKKHLSAYLLMSCSHPGIKPRAIGVKLG